MGVVWRRGLGAASTRERIILLEAERRAKEMAFGAAYQARLDRDDSLLAECADLAVRSTTISWGRFNGYLYIRISVFHRGSRLPTRFGWRTSMR